VIIVECRISAFSRTGGRERNEDACGYLEVQGIVCCVLADGAGGHGGGDVAARLAVQSVLDSFALRPEVSSEAVCNLLLHAHQAVLAQQQSDPSIADMRSTLVALVFDPGMRIAVWGHVGDSRLYLLRNGSMYLRTRDHSLLQSTVDGGILTEEEAPNHCERNILVAAIGSRESFHPTLVDRPLVLLDGDAFLLCSDGFWGLASEQEVENNLGEAVSPDEWLDRMDKLIASRIEQGADNYSVVAVWCGLVDGVMKTIPVGG
jgi:serine/threonine protein phosphatase PrpC